MKRIICSITSICMAFALSYAHPTKTENDRKESVSINYTQDDFIEQLSQELAKALAKRQKRIIVVADFLTIDGKESAFGKSITSELVAKLINSQGDFVIKPTERLRKTLDREKINFDDITDLEKLKLIKKSLEVDSIVVGNIIESGGRTKVNVKIIDVETGNYIGASSIDFTTSVHGIIDPAKNALSSVNKEEQNQNKGTEKIINQAIAQTIVEDFSFKIQSCKLTGQTVVCNIEIANLAENDLIIFFRRGSHISDENGRPYVITDIELGGSLASTERGYSLTSKIPVKGLLRVKQVNPSISQIKLLRFNCRSADRKKMESSPVFNYTFLSPPFEVDLRDVPLSKSN